jgi:predicted PurR-regulated permease PerM
MSVGSVISTPSSSSPASPNHHQPSPSPSAAAPALRWGTGVVGLAAAVALWPFWSPLLLAAWAALVAKPLHGALSRRIHRRKGAAALLTVLVVLAFLGPLVIVTLSLSASAVTLGQRLLESDSGAEALRALASGGDNQSFDVRHLEPKQLLELARQHGASALSVVKVTFGALTVTLLGVIVFVSAFYTFLLEGSALHEWLLVHSPLERGQFHRLSSVFAEVGRGLLVGVGLTALAQGVGATIGYLACGVPQPWVLGLMTVFASLIPSIGSGLVWVPVTIGLFLAGRPGAATAMLAIGCFVSLIDNALRPLLTKYGHLRMHGLLLFVAMLGGIAVFGGSGLLLGPLLVRLTIELLTMLREKSPEVFPSARGLP